MGSFEVSYSGPLEITRIPGKRHFLFFHAKGRRELPLAAKRGRVPHRYNSELYKRAMLSVQQILALSQPRAKIFHNSAFLQIRA